MNICVVTIYRSENPGSCLQAWAMQKVLSEKENKVFFYKNIAPTHTLLRLILILGFAAVRLKPGKVINTFKKYVGFSKMHRNFNQITIAKLRQDRIDYYILGSDVIWDFEGEKKESVRASFWGLPFKGSKIISYAASVANTTSEMLLQNGIDVGSLNHIQSISVRDTHTKEIIQPLTKMSVELVCDPTLLIGADKYDVFIKDIPHEGIGYILVYVFGRISKEAEKELRNFAINRNLKIITFMTRCSYLADIVVPQDPYTWITYFKHADYIITDTFHGNMFSMIFKKQFVSVQRGKNKVNHLLETLKMTHRLADDSESIFSLLEIPIDWQEHENALSEFRNSSLQYLWRALKRSNVL